jgi:2-polyprenyl-3-methyl-5-hydroxy-6-metoxy-1,4-benzoquinol methylase
MSIIIEHSNAEIEISELSNGKRQIFVRSENFALSPIDQGIETEYSLELIKKVLETKGPEVLCDEIRREEDPFYVRICLEKDILAYCCEDEMKGKRILDFGCGSGASSTILARMFPEAEVVGIDLDDKLLSLAKARGSHFGLTNLSFLCSPSGDKLPDGIGEFDFVVLSAVLEHLYPHERKSILEQIWSMLRPGGVLFIDQTPYRFFPLEGHTTRLLFINYLPDKLAYWATRKFSKREGIRQAPTWNCLLRSGIRGSSPSEILRILKKSDSGSFATLLKPTRLGFRDRIDVWYSGYAVYIAKKYPKVRRIQKVLRYTAKAVYWLSGIVLLPTVAVAIRKKSKKQCK